MPWSAPIPSDDVVAIHAAIVPTSNGDGEVVMFGGDNHDLTAARANQFDHAQRFNCRNPTQALIYVHAPTFDVFCAGHAFIGDGRLMVAGGTAEFPPDAGGIHHGHHFEGHRRCAIYDPPTGQFFEVTAMGPEPGLTTGGGRWYPTLCTLPTGEAYAFQGHPLGSDHRHGNNTPERYLPLADQWVMLQAIGDVAGDPILYPRLHVLRDGWVFVSSLIPGYARTIAVNPWSGLVREVSPLPDGAYHGFACPAVMLPLVPGNNYEVRVLLGGGVTSQVIDLGQPNPGWTTVPRTGAVANLARTNSCATLLPTGDVLLTGGTSGGNDQTGVFAPEIYRTPLNSQRSAYLPGVGQWETINESATILRNYHSTALLLPDGRVWTAGGNSPNQPGTPPTPTQKQIEIYDPPYPPGPRPTITSCPEFVAYNDEFSIGVPVAEQIATVILMRCGSVTHAFNIDQRAVVLNFHRTGVNTLAPLAPPDAGVAPPGHYMLFVVDNQGRPCSYAHFVRVGGRVSMFTNRSHFSLHEVEALGSPAYVPSAFYVVLDGFSANDLGSPSRSFPPSFAFAFSDNGAPAPGVSAELVDTLFESPGAPSNVTQRITLAYRLRFSSTAAFNGIAAGADRQIGITVTWGPSRASGNIYVFRHEHVYELDGPTPWLSIDLRVARVARNAGLAGRVNSDPTPFVQGVVDRFRQLPSDESHPFLQLSTDPEGSRLELSPTVRGTLVDNFAFAKVRFRAPTGIHAANVKALFRLFTTAVTNLGYDEATIYRRHGNGANAVALQGTVGGEVASIPFFAQARTANPTTQPDPTNVVTLHGQGPAEVVSYFGCWLDINHNLTIRNQIRGRHQCLVAELHYPTSPIPAGVEPANNDQLAQRNLVIVESDNPGGPAAHTVAHTFELKPSEGAGFVEDVVVSKTDERRAGFPDELFIRWHDLPKDSVATIYFPGADMEDLVARAGRRAGMGAMALVDDHTVGFRVGDASYLPLPGGRTTNLPGLLTIQLPATVRAGSLFTVSVHQISGSSRRIIGSFEFTIPVSRASILVEDAERELAVLRAIGATVPKGNRWEPVFGRYLDVLIDRVRAFGGDPDADPEAHATPSVPSCADGRRHHGKISSLVYDCFGDFEGFVLETCYGSHAFKSREHRVHEIVHEASVHRLPVTVITSAGCPERPEAIEVDRH